MKYLKKISVIAVAVALSVCSLTVPCSAYEKEQNLSNETIQFYDAWKEKYLTKDKYIKQETQYYIYYSEEKFDKNANVSVPVTVSEAHGYGMLIFAHMSDYDKNAKEYFDGMYRYFKAHLSDIGPNLMSWQQCDNGVELIDGAENGSMVGGPCDSATDGDMDIAYALLLADSIWGSDGEIDYYSEAVAVINDIMKYEVNHEYWILTLGDWVSECSPNEKYYSAARASDFIVQYMPVFAKATGDDNWMKVYDATYDIINDMVEEYKTGLLPDFIIRNSNGKFVPAGAGFLESENDGNYYYNSCRTPWRISMDYIINKNENALAFANAVDSFMIQASKNDPWEIMSGYKLDGTPVEDYNDLCFVAPCLISASCGENSGWHDKVRSVVINYGEDVYYGDTIKMLCLIADDGGWLIPENTIKYTMGDINMDGDISISDLILMQEYLLKISKLTDEQMFLADVYEDDHINCIDWVALKRIIIQQ